MNGHKHNKPEPRGSSKLTFMKAIGTIVLLCGAIGAYQPAAAGELRHSYSFDNGAGITGTSTHYRFNSRHGDFLPHNGTPVSRFLLHRDYGAGALHYGGIVSGDEQHYYGGVSLGPATLAYFQGAGDSFSRVRNPLYRDLNQYFFHGGSRSRFELQGAGANLELPGGLSAQLAFSKVTAPEAEDRNGYYAGVHGRLFEAGVFEVERGGVKVGDGLRFAAGTARFGLSYQEIRDEYDAHVRRLAFEWDTGRTSGITVGLEQARNRLYPRADEQRVMLRFRKSFGGAPAFHAAADEGKDTKAEQPGFGKTVGIGVGVGVAAVALSSGDGGKDGAERFAERNDAAFNVLNEVNPVSVRTNLEHGGWVYRNADNTFSHTQAVEGTVNTVNIGDPSTDVPAGTTASASYHTHGGPDPRFHNENFSPRDLRSDRMVGLDGYLGTPAGFMKLHDLETESVRVIGRIAN